MTTKRSHATKKTATTRTTEPNPAPAQQSSPDESRKFSGTFAELEQMVDHSDTIVRVLNRIRSRGGIALEVARRMEAGALMTRRKPVKATNPGKGSRLRLVHRRRRRLWLLPIGDVCHNSGPLLHLQDKINEVAP